MSRKENGTGLGRRDFLKTLCLGGLSAAATSLPEVAGAQEKEKVGPIARRKLGKTGMDVSILTLGGMFDTLNNQLLLKQAYNWGITSWDTAEAYGSEEGYGRFFSKYPEARKDIFLSTKLVAKEGPNYAERLDKSLARLKTDHVELFLVHGISDAKEMTDEWKSFAAKAKQAGKIRFMGFSSHSNMEDCLLAAAKMDWIDAVIISYNFRLMSTPKMQDAVAACEKAGIGLIAMKTQGGGPVQTESEAELKLGGRFLAKGFTDKQARLKAVWENPQIASICSQMHTLSILSANVAAALDKTKLTAAERDLFDEYAKDTRHGYCAGCAKVCTSAIDGKAPIGEVMRCLMYHKDYGNPEQARAAFAALPPETAEHLRTLDFSEAESACPQGLAVSALMREAAKLFG